MGTALSLLSGGCAAKRVDYALVDQGAASGKSFSSLHAEVVGEPASFEKLFSEIHSETAPAPALPPIDFEQWRLLFISLGEKSSSGYQLTIDNVSRVKETVKVKIQIETPPPTGYQAAVMTQPYALIKIKKEKGVKKIALIDSDNKVIEELRVP